MLRLIITCGLLCVGVAWAFAQPAVSPFQISYVAGTRDAAGRFMGGTELMNFAVHDGRLYAGMGYWEDRPGTDPRSGAQVVVRDGPSAPWHSDHVFPGTLRLNALRSVTFTTDGQGNAIPPTSVLLATPDDLVHGTASVWSRDDATGTWTDMVLAHPGAVTDVRALGFHHDAITGVDYVFAGANTNARWLDRGWTYRTTPQENTGIFRGVYDPAILGRIRWNVVPEFTHYVGRPMAFAEANGVLYVVIRGTMYRRVDGPNPTWVKVFSWPRPIAPKNSGLRGLVGFVRRHPEYRPLGPVRSDARRCSSPWKGSRVGSSGSTRWPAIGPSRSWTSRLCCASSGGSRAISMSSSRITICRW
jgi:hypothetical protein